MLRRLLTILSFIGFVGATVAAVRLKKQLDEPPYVNQGDALMVIVNQTGEAVEYVPASTND